MPVLIPYNNLGSLGRRSGIPMIAAKFNGSTGYERLSAFSGVSNSASFTMSCWIKYLPDGDEILQQIFVIRSTNILYFDFFQTPDEYVIAYRNSLGSIINLIEFQPATSEAGWHHILFSRIGNNAWWLYINDFLVWDGSASNAAVNFTASLSNFGIWEDALLYAEVADFWLSTTGIDLSIKANREKFYKNGNPVFLGSNGQLPTGNAPFLFFDAKYESWGTNRGTGGNMNLMSGMDPPTYVESGLFYAE